MDGAIIVVTCYACGWFEKSQVLFPLDGAGGLTGDVIANAIDAINFIDDAAGDGFE